MSLKIITSLSKAVSELAKRPADVVPKDRIRFDGRPIRFGHNKRFYFIGHSTSYRGNISFIAIFGDWVTDTQRILRDWDTKKFESDPEFRKHCIKNLVNKSDDNKKQLYTNFIKSLKEAEHHKYLIKKAIKPYGAKIQSDALIIPATSFEKGYEGEITGYQLIFEEDLKDLKDQEYTKNGKVYINIGDFVVRTDDKGDLNKINRGSTKNAYFKIGEGFSDEVFITEGYATGCTIHRLTDSTVFCGFGKHSLLSIAKHFAEKYINKKFFICLDTDARNEEMEEVDTDVKKEKEPSFEEKIKDKILRSKCLNIHTIIPKPRAIIKDFISDFNDLANTEGDEYAKESILEQSSLEEHVILLGLDGARYTIYNSKQGISYLSQKMTKEELLASVGTKDFLLRMSSTASGNVNYTKIRETIIDNSRYLKFDPDRIKDVGTSINNKDELVINTGQSVIGNQEPHCIYLERSKNDYSYPDPRHSKLNEEAYLELQKCMSLLNFKNKNMAWSLMTWLAIAPFFESLYFKPHLMFYGSSGGGKSWLTTVIQSYLSPFNVERVVTGTTQARFLRKLKEIKRPFIFDEMKFSKANISVWEDILTCFRISASDGLSGGYIERCSGNSFATDRYQCNFIALLSTVSPDIHNKEDESRFLKIALRKQKPIKKNLDAVDSIKKMNIQALAKGVYSECYNSFNDIINDAKDNIRELHLKYEVVGQEAKKLAIVLAFAKNVVIKDTERLEEFKEYLISQEQMDATDESDSVLNELLHTQIFTKNQHTIYQMLWETNLNHLPYCNLVNQGIKKEEGNLLIAVNSILLKREVFNIKSDYSLKWFKILEAKYHKTRKSFNGTQKTCVVIPESDFK